MKDSSMANLRYEPSPIVAVIVVLKSLKQRLQNGEIAICRYLSGCSHQRMLTITHYAHYALFMH